MAAIIGALRGVLSMDSAAFESGAKRAKSTMGGVEMGERGWEIEQTGAARIHSHQDSVAMLDNRPIAKGLEELTRHVVAQSQTVTLLVNRIAATMEGWDDLGLPELRV